MSFFKNVGLKAKLMLGSCSPLILVVILGIITYTSIDSLLQSNLRIPATLAEPTRRMNLIHSASTAIDNLTTVDR